MIFTGFTDGNGNVIPVQGAGTVYNEEKNSIALGKDTVASGKDQFVFGRNNVVDTEDIYAEIVGSDKFKVNKYGIEDIAIGAYVAKTGSPWWTGIKVGNTLEEALQFNFRNYSNLEVYQDADSSYHKLATLGAKDMNGDAFTAFGVNPIPTGNVIGVVMDISNGINNQYPSQGKYLLTGSTYWVYFDDGRVVQFYASNGYVTEWKDADGETQNIPVYSRPTIGSSTTIEPVLSVSKKNIRTLDWEGNEYLLGSLAIGEESVAGTKGQLVFGKKNIVDANKVEIVGGDGEVFNIESLPALNTNDTFIYKTNFSGGTTYDATYISSNLNDFETFVNSNISTLIPDFAGKTFDFKVADSMSSVEVLACFVIKNPTRHNPYNVYDNHFTIIVRYGSNGIYHFGISSTNVVSNNVSIEFGLVSESKKIISYKANGNVRTLDWQGNQWNAGDVTCDDGNGNTISMRDLLSRIATLEAAAAEL